MNYNFILDIHNKISKKILYEYEKEEVRERYKKNLKLLELFTKNIMIKPRSIFESTKLFNQIYRFNIKTETGEMDILAEIPDDMYVSITDEKKSISFRDKEGTFRGISGYFKSDEGTYFITSENETVIVSGRDYEEIVEEVQQSMPNALASDINKAINEKWQKEGQAKQQGIQKLNIHFYDTEAISYLEEHEKNNSPQMIQYYLKEIGIYPDEEIEITASTPEEIIALANEFYLDPFRFIDKQRKENAITNTEGRSR